MRSSLPRSPLRLDGLGRSSRTARQLGHSRGLLLLRRRSVDSGCDGCMLDTFFPSSIQPPIIPSSSYRVASGAGTISDRHAINHYLHVDLRSLFSVKRGDRKQKVATNNKYTARGEGRGQASTRHTRPGGEDSASFFQATTELNSITGHQRPTNDDERLFVSSWFVPACMHPLLLSVGMFTTYPNK